MGFFDNLKSFFQKEKAVEIERREISESKLGEWLDKRLNEIRELLAERRGFLRREVDLILQKLEQQIQILESVDISNKKEHVRVKKITELGKRDYVASLKSFVRKLRGESEFPFILKEIENFSRLSAKSHFKATYLIGKEIEDVHNTLFSLRKLENDFVKENGEFLKNEILFSSFLKKNTERRKFKEEKMKIIEEINNTKKIILNKEQEISGIETEIQKVIKSPLAQKREELIIEKKRIEDEYLHLGVIVKNFVDKRIFEKYAYLEKEKAKIIREYLNDPFDYFIKDYSLNLLEILKECNEKIKKGEIVIKDPEKTIRRMTVNKEFFGDYQKKAAILKKEIEDKENEIRKIVLNTSELRNNKIKKESELKELKMQLEFFIRKENIINGQIADITSSIQEGLSSQQVFLVFEKQ